MHASSNLNFKTYYHNTVCTKYFRTKVLPEVQRTVTVYMYSFTHYIHARTVRKYGSTERSTEVFPEVRVRVPSKVLSYESTTTRVHVGPTCTRVALSISKILNFRYTLLASPRERGRRRQSEMNCAKHRTASIDAKKTGDKCSYAATTRC